MASATVDIALYLVLVSLWPFAAVCGLGSWTNLARSHTSLKAVAFAEMSRRLFSPLLSGAPHWFVGDFMGKGTATVKSSETAGGRPLRLPGFSRSPWLEAAMNARA
jgi:hypothetical protein